MRALLRRRGADHARNAAAVRSLADAARQAREADTLDTLRGIEGAAAAAYFACWPGLLKGDAAKLDFPAVSAARRPAR